MESLDYVALGTTGTSEETPLKALQIAAGNAHVCALLENSKLKCWGGNSFGQLGLEDKSTRGDGLDASSQPLAREVTEMGNSLAYVELGLDSDEKISSIALQRNSSCALTSIGRVKCWGQNQYGQLGINTVSSRGDSTSTMGKNLPHLNFGSDGVITARSLFGSSSYFFGCAILKNGTTKCWGVNDMGQLGQGDTNNRGDGLVDSMSDDDMGAALLGIDLGLNKQATSLALGYNHTCAVLNDASLKCWGDPTGSGHLGQESEETVGQSPNHLDDNLPAINLGSGRTVTQASAGQGFTCALLDDKTVKCFGSNYVGQLGLGDGVQRGHESGTMGDKLPRLEL